MTVTENNLAAPSLNADQLHDAFQAFNRQTGLLEASYRDLQDTVAGLTRQLEREQSARHRELVKKELLGRRLAELLETLPGAILVIDGGGVIRQHNSEASQLLNQPLIGCSWASIVRREVRRDSGEDGNIELCDGRWLSLSRRPLKSEAGEVLLLADVTESRRMSEMLRSHERLSAVGQMTASLAHQIRTPLSSALLYISRAERSTPANDRVAGKIANGLHELKRMVNDMLGFAAGARSAQQSVNVAALLEDTRETLQDQLGAEMNLRVAVTDPALNVAANRDALKGALLNLVSNADQACNGRGNILLHGHRFGDSIHMCVSDDGPGVADTALPHLFDPFFTTRPQGTGLGLSVVKAVAVAHGGEVSVATSDLGTSFTLRLPTNQAGTS